MPTPFEMLRLAREKRFQDRVLAALEKPRRNRFFTIVNSALFLWLLSACVITFGSFYFTTYQQCIREANADSDRYYRLSREVFNRKEYIAGIVVKNKNFEELRVSFAKSIPHVYIEFKDRSLFDLQRELDKIEVKIDKTNVREWIRQTGEGYEGINVSDRDFRRYQSVFNGEISPGIDAGEYTNLNDFAKGVYYLGHRDFRIAQTIDLSPFGVCLGLCWVLQRK